MTNTKSHKEKIGILASVAVIALGMFTVGNSYATGSLWGIGSSQISIDEATTIGISYLGTDSSNLSAVSMEKDGESFVYSLEFNVDNQETSIDIDPHTGEVLSIDGEPTDVESNDGSSISDGDGETNDD